MVSDCETMTTCDSLEKYDNMVLCSGIYDKIQAFRKLAQGATCERPALVLFQCFFECLCNFKPSQTCSSFPNSIDISLCETVPCIYRNVIL